MAVLLIITPPLAAQPVWNIDLGYERSDVTIARTATVWESARLQTSRVNPAIGGWFAAVDRQQRGDLVDVAIGASGYRRLADWTVGGGVAGTINPQFLYRASIEGEIGRRVKGTTVLSMGYRLLDFRLANVHQLQPAISWNHARGEVQGRLYLTRKHQQTADQSSVTALITTYFDVHARLRVSGALAYGDRVFDIASLSTPHARARTLNLRVRVGVTQRDFIEVGFGAAHEQPSFDQRTVSLTYRRVFNAR